MAVGLVNSFFDKKREWSKIKDTLLGCYLKPYSAKIFYTKRDIVYIDAFSGTGKFKDGTSGSPLISYEIFCDAKENSSFSNNVNFICIEKNNYDELNKNLSECKNIEVIADDYENVIKDILSKQYGKNVFLYVDPFGIKNIKMDYFKFANNKSFFSVELLLNFNSFGFIREGCRLLGIDTPFDDVDDEGFSQNIKLVDDEKNDINNMNAIAGGEYWQDIIRSMKLNKLDGYEAEKRFAKEYCNRLKEYTNFKYAINLPIRVNKNNRPKYRMVFATNHLEGFLLMNDGMAKRYSELREHQEKGALCLFEETVENDILEEGKIEKIILELLNNSYEIDINEVILKVIEEIGIYHTSKIRDIISILEKEGKIKIRREPPFTLNGKPTKFLTTSKNKKVYLSL